MHCPCSGLPAAILGALALPAAATLTIDWVTVGDVNNPADPATGYGAVDHAYQIGKFEVTLGQYTEFLNVTAASDPYGLYHEDMGTDVHSAGISRSGSDGGYSYAVIGSANRPVTFISWFDAARMANWMHNGQGSGSTETGAYNLNEAMTGTFIAKPGARVWIPSEDEWYKAAYYSGTGDDYWLYPTQSDSEPSNDLPGSGNNANFYQLGYTLDGSAGYLTEVGAFTDSASHYGSFDQAGNAWEWNDAVIGPLRGLRGGYWSSNANSLSSFGRDSGLSGDNDIGFRLATVPEPSLWVFVMLAGGLGLGRRRRPALCR